MLHRAGRAGAVAKGTDLPFGIDSANDIAGAPGQCTHTMPGQFSIRPRKVRPFLTASCEIAVVPPTARVVLNVRRVIGRTTVVGVRQAQLATLEPWVPVVWYVPGGDDRRTHGIDDADRAAVERVSSVQQPVVVVSASAGIADNLVAFGAEWVRQRMLERDLVEALSRARATSALAAISRTIDTNSTIPAKLRRALVYATIPHASIQSFGTSRLGSVERLARYVECDRSTLTAQWRSAWSRAFAESAPESVDPDLRLEDFVHWPLLIRAVVRKTGRQSWARIATRFGMHEDTLRRASKRLTGRSLAQLAGDGPLSLCGEFFDRVIEPLLASVAEGVR